MSEQAAFLIFAGAAVERAIHACDEPWATAVRSLGRETDEDAAFVGQHNLLNQDQGIRTLMQVINDLFYEHADELKLDSWCGPTGSFVEPDTAISNAVQLFATDPTISSFVNDLASAVSSYDWRASGFPGLSPLERTHKASFRGSGGYRELRRDVLTHLRAGPPRIAALASRVFCKLGFDDGADG